MPALKRPGGPIQQPGLNPGDASDTVHEIYAQHKLRPLADAMGSLPPLGRWHGTGSAGL